MKRFAIITLIGLWSASTISAAILYVDDSAARANNGSSWQDAYLYLQDALAEALSGDEIRVAQGVYRPDQSAYLDGLIEGDRDAAFQLKNGVNLRGGYAGCGTPDPNVRDREIYRTILSGDLGCNDPAVIDPNLFDMVYSFERRDNSIHVVVGTGTDGTAVLEGFVVMGGNANDSGDDGWVSTDCGGGLYNGSGSCTVRECVFMYNSALYGGAVYNRDGSRPAFVNCTFSLNAYAGMYNDAQSSPTLQGCVFEGNQWCGMANCEQSNPILTDCRICRNRENSERGGGIFNVGGSCPVLNRCVFEENFTGQRGGALYCRDNSNAVATGCVFRKNRATWYGGAVFSEWSRPVFRRCVFEDNESNSGGAIGIGNWDWYDGAGSDVSIENCLFALNHAGKQGGAISVEISHQNRLAIINCTFADNTAPTGRAILCDSFMHNYASEVTVSNCILWDGGDEVSVLDRSHVTVRYSDVQGGLADDGTLDLNPMFVKPDAGDYRLQSGSPCVDKGDSSVVPEGALDLDENLRIRGKAVDMGAYEYQYSIGTIIYVDDDATGANNGTSWADAYNYLQDALMFATGRDEIRVAQGVYRPDDFVLSDRPNLGREETFQLVSGVTLKGGYAGLGEPEPNARNITQYPTILSGDLLGNDLEVADPCNLPDEPTRAENSNHIVTAGETDRTAILDGFTITGGYANRNMGGGMYNNAGSPSLYNCTFAGNFAEYGGGMYNSDGASPLLTDCIFNGNAAFDEEGTGGGGMYNDESSPTLINCTFTGNWAGVGIPSHGGGNGGAMAANFGSSPKLTGCSFNYNTALCDGGAMFNDYCNPTVANCTFTANTGRYGGAIHNLQAEPVLTNCIFGGNTARNSGGAVYNVYLSDVILTNCTFAGNRAPAGSAIACFARRPEHFNSTHVTNCIIWDGENSIWNDGASIITVTYSDIRYGWPGEGNIDIDPLFADADNGDYHLKSQAGRWDANEVQWTMDEATSPCIDAGDPMMPIGNEPFPNGGIINIGAYGGTAEASKSYFGKPPCKTMVAGDINGDCKVGLADFAIMAMHWLATNNP